MHTFGVGGLHSDPAKPERFSGKIQDVDASGMYPAIMDEYGLLPRSISDKTVVTKMRRRRDALKAKKDPMADSLKIVNNAVSGATRSGFSALKDPYIGLSVCVVGQLLLVDLLERLEPFIERLIQSNTDGLYLLLKDEEGASKAVKEYEKRTSMKMEWGEFSFMYQHNVNNYVAREAGSGKLKLKGGMFKSAHASVQTPAQKVATARALGEKIDLSQFTLNEFAITCSRDKNSRGFLVNGVETDDEYIEVVAVSPFDCVPISTVTMPSFSRITVELSGPPPPQASI
jgi:hypothetical protein